MRLYVRHGRNAGCERKILREGKLGGPAGGSAGGSTSDSKDKENCGVAQKCAEPGTQRRNRCGRRDGSCRCGRCDRRKSPREGKLGGSAGKSAGGSASDSKDKENCGVAQKCAEPGTQRRNRCGGCGRSCRCGRCDKRKSPREGKTRWICWWIRWRIR